MKLAYKLYGEAAPTSSVSSKQKHLNRANCRNKRFNVNKLLVSWHSGRSCSCYSYVPVWAPKVDVHLVRANSNSIHTLQVHAP